MLAICPACSTANRPLAKFCMKCVAALPGASAGAEEDAFIDARTLAFDLREDFAHTILDDGRARAAITQHALRDGTLIEGFRIVRPIGEGGFGIVYLAWDGALERHVAIKEYMPSSLAMRVDASSGVSMRSERDRSTFEAGLKSFVNEARLLARFDHPALVKVFRFWEANRTAYMAMPFYEGPTLKAALADIDRPMPEAKLREWLAPLLDALTVMHREQCYHRDVSPDNILLTAGGPVLLDFGAARRVISDRTQALTTMLKPGFAPIEQYGGTMMQGPWTDIYALAGVLYYAIAGRPPVPSVVRVVNDTLRPLALTHAGHYSEGFLRAIDAALAVRPEGRPQDVAQFRALLDAGLAPVAPAAPTVSEATRPPAQVAVTTPATIEAVAPDDLFEAGVPGSPAPIAELRRDAGRPAPRRGMYVGTFAMLLLLGGAALGWRGGGTPASSAAPTTAAASVPTPGPVPTEHEPAVARAPAPDATPSVPTAPDALVVAPVAAASPSAAPSPMPARRPATHKLSASAAERVQPTLVRTSAVTSKAAPRDEPPELSPSYTDAGKPPRCSDLVIKSSLESLNSEELGFLNHRCK